MAWLRTLLGIVALMTLALVTYPPSVLALIEVRSGPGVTYEVIAHVTPGSHYVAVAQEQDWYKIQLSDGREGWIHKDNLMQEQSPSRTAPALPMARRTALVIGNAAYPVGPLQNTVKDATDIAAMLHRLGFGVTLLRDVPLQEMEETVNAFNLRLRQGGMGLFYFAGHGIQVDGENYLIPIKARIERQQDVRYQALPMGRVMGAMEDANNGLNILILDASRNLPFSQSWRPSQRGLAPPPPAPPGMLIAYATSPGGMAADGAGENGVYTKHLLQAMAVPGLSIEQVFKQVRYGVVTETEGKQTPWESSSLLGDFAFMPAQADLVSAGAPPPYPSAASDPETALWSMSERSSHPEDVLAFLQAYPESRFAPAARRRLEQLQQSATAANVPFTALSKPEPPPPARYYAVVRVFYATDRSTTGEANLAKFFGTGRGELSYGTCEVSIPSTHRMGELESPSKRRLEFHENPTQHVMLLSITPMQERLYFTQLATHIRTSAGNNAFIFIHGYNVSFEDAARRTAQISYDLNFDGAAVFYSWPSQGTFEGYPIDETNIDWTQAHLRKFLDDLVTRTKAQNIYLIAHSMGNRALVRAFSALIADKPVLRQRFREVILTAPDIDAEVFKRDIAPLVGNPPFVTLYASSQDKALLASKKFHGYPRAGDAGDRLVLVTGIDTIDATGVDTTFVKHSYFAEARSILADLFYLIRDGKRPDYRFGLERVNTVTGWYWKFKQ